MQDRCKYFKCEYEKIKWEEPYPNLWGRVSTTPPLSTHRADTPVFARTAWRPIFGTAHCVLNSTGYGAELQIGVKKCEDCACYSPRY